MSPRKTPTPERFVELLNQFAEHQRLDADTQAIPMGGGDPNAGLVEWVKIHERTMTARAADWITQTALGDEPPFYLARQRDGQLTITRPHPTGMVARLAMTAAELGLCAADVSACLMIDTRGRFYNKITPEGLADSCGQWLITPEAMTHLIVQAAQLAREIAENNRATQAEQDARVDELAGPSLDIIRGLFMAAGLGTDPIDAAPRPHGDSVIVHMRVSGDDITKLADTLAMHGITPITRAEANDNLVIVGEHCGPDGPTGEPTTKVNVTRAEWSTMDQTGWTIVRDPRQATAPTPDATTKRKCPDDGTCHHGCAATCFRVRHCEPLSGVFPGDTWPEGIHARHTTTPPEGGGYAWTEWLAAQMENNPMPTNTGHGSPHDPARAAMFRQAQQTRIVKLSADAADQPVHVQFLADLLDAPPGTDLDDVARPPGLSHGLARALIEDVTWCRRPAPEPGYNIPSFPGAYAARRLRTARAAATRKANQTEAPESSGLAELLDLDRKA